ncbi:hypothetical protein BST83_02460 [Polaribacter filamentus]|uniref:Calx-beta domain-containing protein n=1 Tax=Polaribacter filamentus TaxID=53483 RepID=A0A2S7KU79_9FLAO|nr:hypothetical protein BST83_02460 [Polaribacter filamentus]
MSCNDNEDYTGDSVLKATSPSLNVTLSFENSQTLVEQEKEYAFTVTISEKQVTDVVIYLEQVSGDATDGVDFSIPLTVTIKKGSLSVSDVIAIHADELIEETETATIQIGTGLEANVQSVSGQTVSFSIANLTDGDLVANMSWAASSAVTDNYGNAIEPYDLADLRLLLTDSPYTQVFDSADGAGAETYILSGDAPDGTYSFVADFYAAMSEISADIDITLTFNQVGSINGQTHSFSAALNTTDSCAGLNYVMATVTKSGNSYSFEEVGEKSTLDLSILAGTWSGNATWYEYFGYTSEVVTNVDANGDVYVTGIAFQWFEGWWGEVIISSTPVKVTITDPCTGAFIIEEQPYIVSSYNGAIQPAYGLSGSGTIDFSGASPTMTIYPVFHQSGGTFSGPEFDGIPFAEYLTLD